MATQLSRKFDGETYYCEHIATDKHRAKQLKKSAKEAGFKARVIELQESGKKVYGVFQR